MRWNVLDQPDPRKIHKNATPLLGGAAIFVAFATGILLNGIYSLKLFAILGGAAIVFTVSVVDDFKEVPAFLKLLVQVAGASLVMCFGIVLRVLPEGLGLFGYTTNVLLTLLWIVGVTNAMNFFDGMDGLATGLGAIVSFFLGIVAFQTGQPFLGWISLAIMGSCLGFLPYNFKPKRSASIFLGDGGSNFIGFLLACLAVYGDWSETNPIVALTSPLLIFWILIFDMVHITVDRVITGKVLNFKSWIEYVGKDHLHHRISEVLGGPKKSVLLIYLLSLILGTSAVVLRNARTVDAILLLLQASMIVVLFTILERNGRHLANNKR
jgi:UDP-GlcNAc:undecaprenyl-phosphate GlcNAc-1-phosphate transferase